jgi:hypothetical protein
MDNVKLMSRIDTKFIINIDILPALLRELQSNYYVLEVNGVRNSKYETVYYDTPDFMFYHQHRRGVANRSKVRMRRYVESELNFFEIKSKNNKGRTIKERIKRKQFRTEFSQKAEDFLFEKTHLTGQEIEPKLEVNYSRITLVNKCEPERLTIDTGLCFKKGNTVKDLSRLVIVELKQESKHFGFFSELMHKYHIQDVSISKYCFGIIFLYDGIRMNSFKPKLLKLLKTIS